MTLSGATTLGQSRLGSEGNEGVLCIPQNSIITGALPSDFLVSYRGHSVGVSYSSAEKQSAYSTAPADWATLIILFSITHLFARSWMVQSIIMYHGQFN